MVPCPCQVEVVAWIAGRRSMQALHGFKDAEQGCKLTGFGGCFPRPDHSSMDGRQCSSRLGEDGISPSGC